MNARTIFYAPSGTLRAPWRIGGFLLVFFAAKYALYGVARGLPSPNRFVPNMTEAWLLLLACPLMHFLMHRRHGGQHQDHAGQPGEAGEKKEHGGHGCC